MTQTLFSTFSSPITQRLLAGECFKHGTTVCTSFRPQVSPFCIFPSSFTPEKILGMGGRNGGGWTTGQGGNRKDLDKYAQPSSDKQPYSNRPQQLNNALCLNSLPSNSNLTFFFKKIGTSLKSFGFPRGRELMFTLQRHVLVPQIHQQL